MWHVRGHIVSKSVMPPTLFGSKRVAIDDGLTNPLLAHSHSAVVWGDEGFFSNPRQPNSVTCQPPHLISQYPSLSCDVIL